MRCRPPPTPMEAREAIDAIRQVPSTKSPQSFPIPRDHHNRTFNLKLCQCVRRWKSLVMRSPSRSDSSVVARASRSCNRWPGKPGNSKCFRIGKRFARRTTRASATVARKFNELGKMGEASFAELRNRHPKCHMNCGRKIAPIRPKLLLTIVFSIFTILHRPLPQTRFWTKRGHPEVARDSHG